MQKEEFRRITAEVLDSLPEFWKRRMENVYVVVEDVADAETRKKARIGSGATLLGLYEGVPLDKRGTSYGSFPVLPDRITLFRIPIEALAQSEEDLRERIRTVLIHEVAHHFGMTEEQVRKAGY